MPDSPMDIYNAVEKEAEPLLEKVSLFWENAAKQIPAQDFYGSRARTRAVDYAIRAENYGRAKKLIKKYMVEGYHAKNQKLRDGLQELFEQIPDEHN